MTDSLQRQLALTKDPQTRIQILIDLKDLNEENKLNVLYSRLLFHEAAAVGDTYALSNAIIPILTRDATYVEKEDSIRSYIQTLHRLTLGTPEEGLATYAELFVEYRRLRSFQSKEQYLKLSYEALDWCDSTARHTETIYQRTKRLILQGYAQLNIDFYQKGGKNVYIPQTAVWAEAYELTRQMKSPVIRKHYANIAYLALSGSYNQARRYEDQVALTSNYIAILDQYYAFNQNTGKRSHFYSDNSYVRPYQQLMLCALLSKREADAERYFNEFRQRMLSGRPENRIRNLSYFYETAYIWMTNINRYDKSLQYADSLIRLIDKGQGYFHMMPHKIYQVHHDRGLILLKTGRAAESLAAFEHTLKVQDSLFALEREERLATLQKRLAIDQIQLKKTRAIIRNRVIAILLFVVIMLLLTSTGVFLLRALRRNRLLKSEILNLSRKAQESERMKSSFVNTICRGIGPPLEALDQITRSLMRADASLQERQGYLEPIRESTKQLLSTLDNMLEAANLDSLTDNLQLADTNIDELCRAELLTTSRLDQESDVNYLIEAPHVSETGQCIVRTHAKYFSFVVRALLDNARKFTTQGEITLRYELDLAQNRLLVSITDTGCGIPPERRSVIFRPFTDSAEPSTGLSLSLCRLIARRLSGDIQLDDNYTHGARFIFTIPAQP